MSPIPSVCTMKLNGTYHLQLQILSQKTLETKIFASKINHIYSD